MEMSTQSVSSIGNLDVVIRVKCDGEQRWQIEQTKESVKKLEEETRKRGREIK